MLKYIQRQKHIRSIKKAGFEPIHDTDTYSPRSFLEFVKNAACDLRIDSESLKKLLVYREEFDDFLVDTNSTVRNFIEYMYQNPAKFEDDLLPYCVYMRLSPEALNEWDKFIDKSPIFINKKLPIFYKVGN